MPRPAKKAKTKAPKGPPDIRADGNGAHSESIATAVADGPPQALQPPVTPVEPREQILAERPAPEKRQAGDKTESGVPADKDRIATSLNIAKLQSMSMTELNQMARDLSVENFGTMRKHEV